MLVEHKKTVIMKTTTRPFLLSLSLILLSSYVTQAQETHNKEFEGIPIEGEQATQPRNTFVDYHTYILGSSDFRFRKEIKKAKGTDDYLEYASNNNNIRISKYDYLRLVRRAVNQSDSKSEFINKMIYHFPDAENKFTNTLDLETVYDTTRPKTFFGYFDGLPRIW
jgi:hypothetical protein